MGVFKHSPGCGCCGCASCAAGGGNIDVVIPAASSSSGDCSDCDVSGTYTLTYKPDGYDHSFIGGTLSGTVICYWEGEFSSSIDCIDGNLHIGFSVCFDEFGAAAEVLIDDDDGAGWGVARFYADGDTPSSNFSPSTWFDDGDCGANLTITLEESIGGEKDHFWNCSGFPVGSCCEFSDGVDAVEINP